MGKRRRTPDLPVVLRELCARVVGAAPDGWVRAAVSGVVDPQGVGVTGVSFVLAGGGERVVEVDLRSGLRQAYRAAGSAAGSAVGDADGGSGGPLSVGLVVEASGEYEAVAEWLPPGGRGVLCVVDPGVSPGDPADEQDGPVDSTEAGDPEEAVRLLRECLAFRGVVFGFLDEDPFASLPGPLAAGRLAEVERGLGVAFPADLRALYGVCDGDGEYGVFERLSFWMGAETVAALYGGERHWAVGDWRKRLFDPFLYEAEPCGTVRRAVDRPGWIPFALCTDGDLLAVDMDPAAGGRPGQVIRISVVVGVRYVADSVTSLLRRYVEAFRGGGDLVDENGEFRVEVPEPHREPIRSLQKLSVDDGGEVDLERARRAPHLRAVELRRCASADFSPLREAPLETLDVEMKTVDLAPLAGHPTLRRVTVNSPRPVDLGPLRTLPRLEVLDVSRASVPDLRPIAELDGLRYLALRYEQWEELWSVTDRMPPLGLACGVGKGSLDRAATWLAQLKTRTGQRGVGVGAGVGETHRGRL